MMTMNSVRIVNNRRLRLHCKALRSLTTWFVFIVYCIHQITSHNDSSGQQSVDQDTWAPHTPDQRPLNQFIAHHETLAYSLKPIHNRLKRSLTSQQPSKADPLHIEFHAHGKHFKLKLHQDASSVFSSTAEFIDSQGKPIDIPTDHLYSGHLHDEPDGSHVYGHVVDGVFEGRIHSPKDGTFYVERTYRYPHVLARKKKAHSVIYKGEHVRHPQSEHFEGGCGDDNVRQWMQSISTSAVPNSEDSKYHVKPKKSMQDEVFVQTLNGRDPNNPHLMYTARQNEAYQVESDLKRTKRDLNRFPNPPYRRAHGLSYPFEDEPNPLLNPAFRISYDHKSRGVPGTNNPKPGYGNGVYGASHSDPRQNYRACSLYIQTDTFLWEHIRKEVTSDGKAREEISSLVAQHIKAVNHIYENTDFNGIRGLRFVVQRLRVNDSNACDAQKKREQNSFCSPNIDVSNFLNLNSQSNHDDFCLAYIFTYRDFSGGTLGLAWVASTSGASGGICEKYKTYTENVHGRQVQTKRSLNTGIITFVNYNSRVPPKVSELTLAHEIGHNFGSPHDYPQDCRPGGQVGNYIMYSSATSGERPNNNKFSPCSMRNISAVLEAVFKLDSKHNCFLEHEGPFCGNKIVEEGEECDCGYDAKECTDRCCFPRDTGESIRCTRTFGSACSPSEGPCCTDTCEFVNSSTICRTSSECTYESSCNGRAAQCPHPTPRSNRTECNGGTQVCINGQCAGSICLKHNLQECFLTSKNGAKPAEMCEVACQLDNDSGSCRRISEILHMQNITGLKLKPGSPCNDFQGYCDVFQLCRAVDAEGPLVRLKNLLFNHKTLTSIRQWVTTYWWACMLMGIGLILFMAAFIKCCAVHTPSSNPKKRPAVRIQDTLRRPADTLRRKRYRSGQPQTRRHGGQSGHSSGHGPNSIPLQATGTPSNAALHGTGTPYQQSQQPQLVVALPPENPSGSSRTVDPPPPYTSQSSSANTSQPPPLPPPRPSTSNQAQSNALSAASIQHQSSAHSSSSSGSHHNLLPSRGYGQGRGHYNRKGQATVPTGSKSGQSSSSKPQSSRSKK